jgi:histone-lysine N-methyltransferase SETMAR
VVECGPCLVFASFTLAFALQLRKKHGKTSVRVRKTSVRLRKTSVTLEYTYYQIHPHIGKGKTITGEYYSNLLTRLDEKIHEKRPGLKKKTICHQDNAPTHRSVLTTGMLRDLHHELLEHPPYSPGLAPSDFCFFPKHKFFLAGGHFFSNQEAIAAVEGYFADVTKNHYREGIMALEHRWNKCVSLKGDYVEK